MLVNNKDSMLIVLLLILISVTSAIITLLTLGNNYILIFGVSLKIDNDIFQYIVGIVGVLSLLVLLLILMKQAIDQYSRWVLDNYTNPGDLYPNSKSDDPYYLQSVNNDIH